MVELDRQPAAGRAAQLAAVQPYPQERVGPSNRSSGPLGVPVGRQPEAEPVAGRILGGDVRGTPGRVEDVGVGRARRGRGAASGTAPAGVAQPLSSNQGRPAGHWRRPGERREPPRLDRSSDRASETAQARGAAPRRPAPAAPAGQATHAPVRWSSRACSGRSTGRGRPTSARARPPRVTPPASSHAGATACLVSGSPATGTAYPGRRVSVQLGEPGQARRLVGRGGELHEGGQPPRRGRRPPPRR